MFFRSLAIVIVLHSSTFAQLPDFKTRSSVEFATGDAQSSRIRVIDVNQDAWYVMRSKLRGESRIELPWIIQRYDQKSLNVKSVSLKLKGESKKARVDDVIGLNGKLFLIYSQTDARQRQTRLAMTGLDPKTLEPIGERKTLCTIKHAEWSKIRDGRFRVELSGDRSKILCFRELTGNRAGKNVYSFVMLDSAFQLLWKKEYQIPYGPGQFTPVSVKVGNNGDAYILGNANSNLGINAVYDLLLIQKNGESVLRYPQRIQGGFVSSMKIEIRGGELYCMGFYSRLGGLRACGVYFSVLDLKTNQVKSHCHSDFDIKFILQDLSKYDMRWAMLRADQGEPTELYNFNADYLEVGKDGSVILFGEQNYRYINGYSRARSYGIGSRGVAQGGNSPSTLRIPPGNSIYSSPRNYNGHIMVVKVDSMGQILWTQKIKKAQDTNPRNGVFASYFVAHIKNRLCIVFNDDPRNLSDSKKHDYSAVHSMVMMVSLDSDGNQFTYPVLESADKRIPVRPSMTNQTSTDELILFGRKGKTEQFTRVQFK